MGSTQYEVYGLESCESQEGGFVVNATYTGAVGTFDIATTAIGLDRNASEMYHLSELEDSLPQGVMYEGCFNTNTLYRYVVYYTGDEVDAADSIVGMYKLFINARQVVDGNTLVYADKFTEFYFYGDEQDCPIGMVRFTLTIQFDSYPDEITWVLESLDGGPMWFRSRETSILPSGFQPSYYTPEFTNDTLFVDRCISFDVRYRFTISDYFGDGLESPGYYKITSNGVVIKQGGSFGISDSTDFYSNGEIIPPPTPAPFSPYPTAPFSSYPTNPSPTPGPTVTSSPTTETPAPVMPSPHLIYAPIATGPPPISFPVETRSPVGGTPVSFPDDPPRKAPTPVPWCFSGSTTVNVKSKGKTRMQDLNIGDEIAVGEKGVYEPVYSFGHYDPQGLAELLEIETTHLTTTATLLRVSHEHLIFVKKNGGVVAVPAASISVGDALVNFFGTDDESSKEMAIVKSVKPVFSVDGLYAPFTPSGKLLVNDGLLVSSFVALNGERAMSLGGVEVTHQWLAHSFEFPHRLFCYYNKKKCDVERYTSSGISMWVAAPLDAASWWLKMESLFWKDLLFFAFLVVLSCFNLFERILFRHHGVLALAGIICFERCYFAGRGQQPRKIEDNKTEQKH